MKPFQTGSGNLLADRRADYAEMLFGSGEPGPAAELMIGALELAPDWSLGWFRLGEFHEAAGDPDAAVQAWRMAERLDPQDRAGAALKLALAGAAPAASRPPSAFVETLFDQYAERFDHALVDALDYRAPDLLLEAIAGQGTRRFGLALDLGCGTGLMGERLRPLCAELVGFDLSAEMLRKARGKGVYDWLEKADLQDFAYAGPPADVVTAADVFTYLGALDRIVAQVAGMLAPGGLFAFSVERLAGAETAAGYVLQPSRRYAHAQGYLRGLLAANGLAVASLDGAVIRQDRNQPVEGLIVVACKN